MVQNNLSGLAGESQRDSGLKPKVARNELPWVDVVRNFFNPNGVVAAPWSTVPQPRWGWWDSLQLTQGSSFLATLGWRTQSRWDCRQTSPETISGVAAGHGPVETAGINTHFQPSLRDLNRFATFPGVETPGYCRSSLRDGDGGADVAPTELKNILDAGSTKIPLLRSWEIDLARN